MRATHRIGLLAVITAFMAVSVIVCGSIQSAPIKAADTPIVAKCKDDLAKRLGILAEVINTVKVETVTMPDSSLGMPERDKLYAQVLSSGMRIILEAKNHQYLYLSTSNSVKYAGPVNIWAYSTLYTIPIRNEPNMNKDLYQCSFLGTNNVRLASGISEYIPQAKGIILATQRTSRSGFDLLYINAAKPMKSTRLYSAFYVTNAVINEDQSKWAAIVRSMVGSGWRVVFSDLNKPDSKKFMIPLPDDTRPERLAWSGDNLMMIAKKGEKSVYLEVSSKLAVPDTAAMWESADIPWKEAAMYRFPGLPEYMLNKSESLEITQKKVDDVPLTSANTPYAEIARVWFTGDRSIVAEIKNFKMQGQDFLGRQYAVVWGEQRSKQVFYAVDIWTNEVIRGYEGTGEDIKPFTYQPYHSPMNLKMK